MRIACLPVLLGCVLCAASAFAADLLPNGDFEAGLTGWQVKTDPGAAATVSGLKPAAGQSALSLQSNLKAAAWALSPELVGVTPGQTLRLVFSARRALGQTALLLDVVNDLGDVSEAAVWEANLPADANWHKISLWLKLPPVGGDGKTHLAFGTIGGVGAWQVDEISLQSAAAPAFAAPDTAGQVPTTGALAPDWQPEGLLDALTRQIGGENELSVSVNGIEVGVRPDFNCARGCREGMTVFATNRGDLDKTLRAEVAGPPGLDSPAWDVPVRKTPTTTVFHLAVQSLRRGDFWIKLTFSSDGKSASLPVKVHCREDYPVLGASWHGAVDEATLADLRQLPVDLHSLIAPADAAAFEPLVAPVKAAGADYIAAPQAGTLTPQQYFAVLSQLSAALQPTAWLPYPGSDPTAAITAGGGLAGLLRKQQAASWVFVPSLELSRDWQKSALLPARADLLTADRVGGMRGLACRLPRLAPACVLGEQVDGRAEVIGGAVTAQARQSDLAAARALLAERRLSLTLLVDGLQARRGGDERLEALQLARASPTSSTRAVPVYSSRPGAPRARPSASRPSPKPTARCARLCRSRGSCSRSWPPPTPSSPSPTSPDVSATCNTPVTYRPFLRGGEGIVVLWNNTSTARSVTLEFRSQPVVSHRVVLSYGGEFALRRWEPIMKFPEEAFKRGIPSI